jgi:hypothetical protein
VALQLDLSHALRTLAELRGLVEAIRDAPHKEPEPDWLEWKTGFDLASEVEHRFETAKHILGFGNRSPLVAQPYMEGTAYLVLGAEPGNVVGVAPLDPADIDNWLSKYVAPGRPRWRSDAVEVDSCNVIVITVEAPRWGDSQCTLQHGFAGFRAGRIFVRRGGTTAEASPSEIVQLETRLVRGADDIDVALQADLPLGPLQALELSDAHREQWLEQERDRLLGALPTRHDYRFGSSLFDGRTAEQYRAEAQEYLHDAGRRWQTLALAAAIKHELAVARFTLVNNTPRNFEKTVLELSLPPNAKAFLDRHGPSDWLDPPDPPEVYGRGLVTIPKFTPPVSIHREVDEVTAEDGLDQVRFHPRDLRPHSRVSLPEVHFYLSPEIAGQALEISWRATSTSATNFAAGVVSLEASGQPAQMSESEQDDED